MESKEQRAREQLTKMVSREPMRLRSRIGHIVDDYLTAEDLAQESLLRAFRHIGTLRGPADEALLCKWLDRIACNVAFNHTRDDRRRPTTVSLDEGNQPLLERLPAPEPDPDTAVHQQESEQKLLTLIDALPADLRAVFLLRDVKGLSTRETAVALEIKEGLVKWRLHQARKQLREQIQIAAQ